LITCFELGALSSTIKIRQVTSLSALADLSQGEPINRNQFQAEDRWTRLMRLRRPGVQEGFRRVLLGSLFKVRRGIATGANGYFVMTREEASSRDLDHWCKPVITRATEIFESHGVIKDSPLRKVILCVAPGTRRRESRSLNSYLAKGEHGRRTEPRIKDRYLCSHRYPWWQVEAPEPAPLVVTYMARRPPAFALNPDKLALLNIGHHLYPRNPDLDLDAIVEELNRQRSQLVGHGRTYQGGLEKFEPREIADLAVDLPEYLLRPADIARRPS
jgi:hypothetical protein